MSGTENDVTGALRTGIISGHTFVNRVVQYYDVDGTALLEGDIALGPTEDVERQTASCLAVNQNPATVQNVTTTPNLRWPNAVVPYEIADDLPDQQLVRDAIAHINDNTVIDFVPKSTEYDYVRFEYHPEINDSHIGRVGGRQLIRLTDNFTRGTVLHEIMHCLGAWHEHSRPDRDSFIEIRKENIEPGKEVHFNQHISENYDVGGYDYGSIMHYPRDAFSNGEGDTIVPRDPNAQIGQRDGLSPLDADAVRYMYAPWAFAKLPATIVPDLVGLDAGDAASSLAAAGLHATWFYSYSASPAGTVLGQSVMPGAEWPPGSPIPVTVSLGPNPHPQAELSPADKNAEDKRFLDDPERLYPYTQIQGVNWHVPIPRDQRAVPFALATEAAAQTGSPPNPGHVTATLVVQLEKVLNTLTWANAVHGLSEADKECWAGVAVVYARLIARLAERAP